MESHLVELTQEDYARLNSLYPEGAGSGLIGKRAEEIVRVHFRRRYPACEFQSPDSGADLKVVVCAGSPALLIEVKGTASVGIAWAQLKVSSPHSHRLLVEAGIPVYRVSEVFSPTPEIYVLKYGADFVLEQEARWAFKPAVGRIPQGHSAVPKQPAMQLGAKSQGSKYDALRRHLEAQQAIRVTLSFNQAVAILGFPLPSSAYKYQAFWANQTDTTNRPWARAWQAAGYEVESYRLSENDGWVQFRRQGT